MCHACNTCQRGLRGLLKIQTRVVISQYFQGLFEIFLLVPVVATKLSFTTTSIYSIWGILQATRYLISNCRICFSLVTCHNSIWNWEKMLKYSNTQMALTFSKLKTETVETGTTYNQSENKYIRTRSVLVFPFLTLKRQEFLECT